MIDRLQGGDAKFDFLVQPRTSNAMSVEDCENEWTEAHAPFHKVATITIPKQVFATPERDALAENFSFNPWHALPQHRLLGSVNRIRMPARLVRVREVTETLQAPRRVHAASANWTEPSSLVMSGSWPIRTLPNGKVRVAVIRPEPEFRN